jgi:hypothetical protein
MLQGFFSLSRSTCSDGGFGLWLGDKGIVNGKTSTILHILTLYVLGLKKNLVSISTIEDRGYEASFRGGHVFLYSKGSSVTSAKVIGIRHEKLYTLMFHPARALMHSTSSSDLCELWHTRMAHLHYYPRSLGITRRSCLEAHRS